MRLEPEWTRLQKEWNEAQSELRAADALFDVGEHVKVEEKCKRGCCVEHFYEGVVGYNNNDGKYTIHNMNGCVIATNISRFNMKRLCNGSKTPYYGGDGGYDPC